MDQAIWNLLPEAEKAWFEELDKGQLEGVESLLDRYYGQISDGFDHRVLAALREQFFHRLERAFLTAPYRYNIDKVLSLIMEKVVHDPPPIHFLEKLLMLLDEDAKAIDGECKYLMALCLFNFAPEHPDFLDLLGAGIEKQVERLCSKNPSFGLNILLRSVVIKLKDRLQC